MYYDHLKELPNFTDKDKDFIEYAGEVKQSHQFNESRAISEMYLVKKLETMTKDMIASNEKLAKSNKWHSWAMVCLTGALVFTSVLQIFKDPILKIFK